MVGHFLSTKVSLEWRLIKSGFRDLQKVSLFPEQMCRSFNRGNKDYRDYYYFLKALYFYLFIYLFVCFPRGRLVESLKDHVNNSPGPNLVSRE